MLAVLWFRLPLLLLLVKESAKLLFRLLFVSTSSKSILLMLFKLPALLTLLPLCLFLVFGLTMLNNLSACFSSTVRISLSVSSDSSVVSFNAWCVGTSATCRPKSLTGWFRLWLAGCELTLMWLGRCLFRLLLAYRYSSRIRSVVFVEVFDVLAESISSLPLPPLAEYLVGGDCALVGWEKGSVHSLAHLVNLLDVRPLRRLWLDALVD